MNQNQWPIPSSNRCSRNAMLPYKITTPPCLAISINSHRRISLLIAVRHLHFRYFVALPKDRGTVSNEEFRRQISQVDAEVLHHLRENVAGGFDEDKFGSFVGFNNLKQFLELELQKRYKEATPATLSLLEQRCTEVSNELCRMESKIEAASDVSHLRRSAILLTASICSHVEALIDGAADPAPEQWGRTTDEEQSESGIGSWPGVTISKLLSYVVWWSCI